MSGRGAEGASSYQAAPGSAPDECEKPVSNTHRSRIETLGALQISQCRKRDPAPRFPSYEVQQQGNRGERDEGEDPRMKDAHARRARFSRY